MIKTIKALIEVLQSKDIHFINEKYNGAVIPAR